MHMFRKQHSLLHTFHTRQTIPVFMKKRSFVLGEKIYETLLEIQSLSVKY